MPLPYIILDTDGSGLAAKVAFNGIVLTDASLVPPVRHSNRLNGWVVQGRNLLRVTLRAIPQPEEQPKPAQTRSDGPAPPERSANGPHFSLRLRSVMPGEDTGSDSVLAEYRWDSAALPLVLGQPDVIALERGLTLDAPGPWLWTQAAAMPRLQAADLNAVADLLAELRDALANKSIADVLRLQSVQLREQAIAIGDDPVALNQRYREFLTGRMALPDWNVAPFERRALTATAMADGRVQRIADAAGQPLIVATCEAGVFAILPFVAKNSGEWRIVR